MTKPDLPGGEHVQIQALTNDRIAVVGQALDSALQGDRFRAVQLFPDGLGRVVEVTAAGDDIDAEGLVQFCGSDSATPIDRPRFDEILRAGALPGVGHRPCPGTTRERVTCPEDGCIRIGGHLDRDVRHVDASGREWGPVHSVFDADLEPTGLVVNPKTAEFVKKKFEADGLPVPKMTIVKPTPEQEPTEEAPKTCTHDVFGFSYLDGVVCNGCGKTAATVVFLLRANLTAKEEECKRLDGLAAQYIERSSVLEKANEEITRIANERREELADLKAWKDLQESIPGSYDDYVAFCKEIHSTFDLKPGDSALTAVRAALAELALLKEATTGDDEQRARAQSAETELAEAREEIGKLKETIAGWVMRHKRKGEEVAAQSSEIEKRDEALDAAQATATEQAQEIERLEKDRTNLVRERADLLVERDTAIEQRDEADTEIDHMKNERADAETKWIDILGWVYLDSGETVEMAGVEQAHARALETIVGREKERVEAQAILSSEGIGMVTCHECDLEKPCRPFDGYMVCLDCVADLAQSAAGTEAKLREVEKERDGWKDTASDWCKQDNKRAGELNEEIAKSDALGERVRVLEGQRTALMDAAEAGVDALDRLMGDSDLDDDRSPEYAAMLALTSARAFASAPTPPADEPACHPCPGCPECRPELEPDAGEGAITDNDGVVEWAKGKNYAAAEEPADCSPCLGVEVGCEGDQPCPDFEAVEPAAEPERWEYACENCDWAGTDGFEPMAPVEGDKPTCPKCGASDAIYEAGPDRPAPQHDREERVGTWTEDDHEEGWDCSEHGHWPHGQIRCPVLVDGELCGAARPTEDKDADDACSWGDCATACDGAGCGCGCHGVDGESGDE